MTQYTAQRAAQAAPAALWTSAAGCGTSWATSRPPTASCRPFPAPTTTLATASSGKLSSVSSPLPTCVTYARGQDWWNLSSWCNFVCRFIVLYKENLSQYNFIVQHRYTKKLCYTLIANRKKLFG